MEKAILKTLIYADIFDYPLTLFEIHKWLIGKKATLRQVEFAIGGLVQSEKCKVKSGYFLLPKREGLVSKRKRREKQSAVYLKKVRLIVRLLKTIPWVKLVGISGGLAMENAEKSDDIDLFLVTAKNRLWISRLLTLAILAMTGQRRTVKDSKRQAAGKLCPNIFVEEDQLSQMSQDLYLAHEILQMQLLWQRDNVYGKYLEENDWAFEFLPNWVGSLSSRRRSGSTSERELDNWIPASAGMTMEKLAKWLQLKLMSQPKGMERILNGAVYFHPDDYRLKVLSEYQRKIRKIKKIYPERA